MYSALYAFIELKMAKNPTINVSMCCGPDYFQVVYLPSFLSIATIGLRRQFWKHIVCTCTSFWVQSHTVTLDWAALNEKTIYYLDT